MPGDAPAPGSQTASEVQSDSDSAAKSRLLSLGLPAAEQQRAGRQVWF